MQAVIAAIDAQASAGYIEIATAAFATLLVTITCSKPSFTESGGVITMAGAPKSGVGVAGGTAAVARIKDGSGNVVVDNLAVGTAGTEIVLNSVSVASLQTITLSAGTIKHAP